MLAADKPPDKTKDKQDSGGPACRHVPVRDSAVSFRGQKGNRDRRDQQPVEKPERGIPNPETITVARFCHEHHLSPWPLAIREIADGALTNAGQRRRSEEHTSELQSLMRTSYAVFCLKKKNKQTQHHSNVSSQIVSTANDISNVDTVHSPDTLTILTGNDLCDTDS